MFVYKTTRMLISCKSLKLSKWACKGKCIVYASWKYKRASDLQLMFSNKDDPPSVKEARAIEKTYIRQWIQEARQRPGKLQQPQQIVQEWPSLVLWMKTRQLPFGHCQICFEGGWQFQRSCRQNEAVVYCVENGSCAAFYGSDCLAAQICKFWSSAAEKPLLPALFVSEV